MEQGKGFADRCSGLSDHRHCDGSLAFFRHHCVFPVSRIERNLSVLVPADGIPALRSSVFRAGHQLRCHRYLRRNSDYAGPFRKCGSGSGRRCHPLRCLFRRPLLPHVFLCHTGGRLHRNTALCQRPGNAENRGPAHGADHCNLCRALFPESHCLRGSDGARLPLRKFLSALGHAFTGRGHADPSPVKSTRQMGHGYQRSLRLWPDGPSAGNALGPWLSAQSVPSA